MLRLSALLMLLASATSTSAKSIKVLVDVAPLHSLVSMVMGDTDKPDLLLPAQASAHHFSMRPSQARLLADADIVFWVGPSLTPWLDEGIEALFNGHPVAMLGPEALEFREEHDDHDDEHEDDHAEADGDKHEDEHEDAHEDEHEDEHGHGDGPDPHAWLDPEVAILWLGKIAVELSAIDSDNANTYADRAAQAQQQIADLAADMANQLAPFKGQAYLTDHDSFQYFDTRFGLTFAGAITDGDEAPPSAAHVEELIETAEHARCFITTSPNPITRTIMDGAQIEKEFPLDPLGRLLEPGAELYPTLMRNLSETIQSCMEVPS